MKYFVILLVLFTVSFLTVNHAYGIWLPQSPEELLEESQLIFVGTISSINKLEFERSSSYITTENGSEKEVIENYPLILDEYTVTVEEFVKNPQDTDTITVLQPTVSTPGRLLPHGGFEIGDRVLFYIESFDGTNTYSKESFLIPEQCETSSVIHEPKIIGSDYTMMQNGMEKKDNFTANIPIQFIAKSDTGTLSGDSPSIEYDAFISKQVGKIYKERVFHQTVTADAKPCEWLSVAKWEFTPDAGNYLLNGDVYKEKSRYSISNMFFSVLPETPLKQIQSGIPFNEIQCKQNLVLIQKYDGTPACVTESTKLKLIERGWTEQSLPPCTSDRVACFNQESNLCDPSGWDCDDGEVFSETISIPEPKRPSIAFPYIWNNFLHKQGIEFEPKNQSYWNTGEGWYSGDNRVCSPIIASNGTKLYVSSVFIDEPFEIIGTYIDNTKPDDCHKVWKTDSVLPEPDKELKVWLEVYHNKTE